MDQESHSEYFEKWDGYMDDINVVKTCINEYYKNLEGADRFRRIPLSCTEYHKDSKKLSDSNMELWLEAFTRDKNYPENDIIFEGNTTMTSTDAFENYKTWYSLFIMDNGVKLNMACVKFGTMLTRLH